MKATNRAYLELHIAVFLFGFTAILGDLIQLSALALVWWRVLLTSISLLFLIKVRALFRELPRRTLLAFMGIGILVAWHWLCFYGAIKWANASIALVAMATTSFFTSLLEPLVMRQPIKWYELALGIFIIPGMLLIVNGIKIAMLNGLYLGLAAALLAALFATLNKKLIGQSSALNITFLELSSAWLFLSLVLPVYAASNFEMRQFLPSISDVVYLLVLSLMCTTLAYVLALRALRHLSAFASNLAINLEPVYGILLAWLILREDKELHPNFYWGVVIIVIAVFCYPLLRKWIEKIKAPS